jgi:serine/threonine-protein kinase
MTGALDESLVISGFELVTKLSSGGMGDVLLARRRGVHGFEKLVAIKTIRGELTKRSDIRAMFLDEARLSARLDHPNIAQVYDFGEEHGTLYLAMEYVPGLALNKLLAKRGGPLPPRVAMRIVAEVCRGLHAAHELADLDGALLGVVHRDVSPGNLILTFDGRMKILDFGIAFMKNRESPDTIVGELKGKPSYMAPEHLRAQGVDRRADIYSASVVLHELLTGRKLFTRETVVATVLAVESQQVARPSSIAGALPAGLDEIVMRGLERKPADRFPDARAMATSLDRLISELGGETLEAFVESELSFERESHRQWLQSALVHRDISSPHAHYDPNSPNRTPTGAGRVRAIAILDQPREHGEPPTRDDLPATAPPHLLRPSTSSPAMQRVSPLVDHTTLVPPGAEVSEPVQAIAPRSSNKLVAMLGVFVVCFVGAIVGYRVLFPEPMTSPVDEHVDAVLPNPEEKIAAVAAVNVAPTATSAAGAAAAEETADPEPQVEETIEAVQQPRTRPRPQHTKRPNRPPVVEKKNDPKPDAKLEGFGFVTIGAQPYALVRIDGQEVGVTPIMRKKLGAGAHEIQLVSPDSGAVRLKKMVTLTDGEHQRITLP